MNPEDLPTVDNPENRKILLKESLLTARKSLLIAQDIVRPTDFRWKEIDEIIALLEEMIIKNK